MRNTVADGPSAMRSSGATIWVRVRVPESAVRDRMFGMAEIVGVDMAVPCRRRRRRISLSTEKSAFPLVTRRNRQKRRRN